LNNYLFTSQSVAEGHPDKMADQIADAILDAVLLQDPEGKVICNCLIKTGVVIVAGDISTHAAIDIEQIVRSTIKETGFDHSRLGFDGTTCAVLNIIGKPSSAAHGDGAKELTAGEQAIAFGYACSETPERMPAAQLYAHRLMARQAELRKSRRLPFLLPDARCMVTLRYQGGQVHSLDSVLLSTQHGPDISLDVLREAVTEEIIKPVIPARWLTPQTRFLVNPAGRFITGGPAARCGLSGRQTIVDSYGGACRYGGGVFSGRDPSKIDRAAAYAARYIAKNIVAAGLASRCEIELSWADGLPRPLLISIHTFGTHTLSLEALQRSVHRHFDLSLCHIISMLDLLVPRYRKTACYGHFGRDGFPWEITDKAALLREDARR